MHWYGNLTLSHSVERHRRLVIQSCSVQIPSLAWMKTAIGAYAQTPSFPRLATKNNFDSTAHLFARGLSTKRQQLRAFVYSSIGVIYTKVAFLAEVPFLVATAAKREYIQSGQGGPL